MENSTVKILFSRLVFFNFLFTWLLYPSVIIFVDYLALSGEHYEVYNTMYESMCRVVSRNRHWRNSRDIKYKKKGKKKDRKKTI